MQNLLLLALSLFLLSSCDKGRSSLEKIDTEFKHVLENPITDENLRQAQTAALGYKILSQAHAGEGSAKIAEERAAKIGEKAKVYLQGLRASLVGISKEFGAAFVEPSILAEKMQKLAKERKKRNSFSKSPSFKVGDCFVRDNSEEFKEAPALFEIDIYRVEKVGEERLLVKKLFEEHNIDRLDKDWLKKTQAAPAASEHKFTFRNAAKIDCSLAEQLQQGFQDAAPVATKLRNVAKSISTAEALSSL